MQYYPLLDIEQALRDAARNLDDVVRYVKTLQDESDGHFPPDGAQVLANVAEVRERLAWIIPPALREAINAEHQAYDEDEQYWST